MEYSKFIEKKQKTVTESGFQISESDLNTFLFPFQKHIVKRGLEVGKFAIFADCGLGKTLMQLEWAQQVANKTGNPVLILAPLAVKEQTINEGRKFGIEVGNVGSKAAIHITNYEQLEKTNTEIYSGIVLDESSILKNFTGVYKNLIIETFQTTPYKLACTATPAPNDLNEIGNHSEFLDVMDANDMRMRWFIRDEGMNNYRLKGHAENDFYGWISSWAAVLRNPKDIGFPMEGYDLPALNYFEYQVKTDKKNNGKLFNDESVNATEFNKELRLTIIPRMEYVAEIVNNSTERFIIWVNQDVEEDKICSLIPDAVAVRGSEKPEKKAEKLLGFANNEFRVLVTKKKIAQFGLNFQNCNNQIFASLDFSFEGLYQAIRRSYRFGQKNEVNIYIVSTDTMQNVVNTIHEKQKVFNEMMCKISESVNKFTYRMKVDYEFKKSEGNDYEIYNGDSCEIIQKIESNSIDFSIFSPPFSNLFTYSDNIRDMGNCVDDSEFFEQQAYLLKELYRIIKPGRLVAVHTKDLARYKNSSGYSGMYDFTGDYHRAMEKAGFKYHSKITIWIDPVLEMQRTKTQRLLYKQVTSDSSYTGIGMPEYVTIFRKWEGDEAEWTPINNKTKQNFDLNTWQKWASPIWAIENIDKDMEMILPLLSDEALSELPEKLLKKYAKGVWFDIQRTNVLNNHKSATEQKDEKHICPLQLDIIERCIQLWSNPGEVVFTPFMGIGSEVYTALKLGRKGVGIELKESYFDVAVKNCKSVAVEKKQLALF